MATYLDGNVRRATENTVTAMRRSAAVRQCPECGRKSATVRDHDMGATYCRWAAEVDTLGRKMCTYYRDWSEE